MEEKEPPKYLQVIAAQGRTHHCKYEKECKENSEGTEIKEER